MKVSSQEKIVKLGRSAAWICVQNSCRKIQTDLLRHEVTGLPMGYAGHVFGDHILDE